MRDERQHQRREQPAQALLRVLGAVDEPENGDSDDDRDDQPKPQRRVESIAQRKQRNRVGQRVAEKPQQLDERVRLDGHSRGFAARHLR